MSLLDRHGREIPVEKVRKALGFIERTVKADDSETINGVRPRDAVREPGWWQHDGGESYRIPEHMERRNR